MTRAAYYRHIRSPAVDAYRLAGEAARLDEARQIERTNASLRQESDHLDPIKGL